MQELIDLIGRRFNRLKVISRAKNNRWGNLQWLCECDCGNKKIIVGNSLKRGLTKSCGCLNIKKIKQRFTKHGYRKNKKGFKIYNIWVHMIQRCTNPNNKKYSIYGGRGITVCKRWRNSFPNFLKDMGECPGPGYSIHRKNNYKGYCKENCKWATNKEQNRNRRNNVYITYGGRTQLLIEWSEETGIPYMILWNRIYRYHWSVENAFITPIRKRIKKWTRNL